MLGNNYWYKITVFYCPACGCESRIRERQYTEKPEDPDKRIDWIERYDWCDAF